MFTQVIEHIQSFDHWVQKVCKATVILTCICTSVNEFVEPLFEKWVSYLDLVQMDQCLSLQHFMYLINTHADVSIKL